MNVFDTEWYKKIKAKITHGENLKIYREKSGMTQEKLGQLLGGIAQNISNVEKGTRAISIKIAHKLTEIFNTSTEKFI